MSTRCVACNSILLPQAKSTEICYACNRASRMYDEVYDAAEIERMRPEEFEVEEF